MCRFGPCVSFTFRNGEAGPNRPCGHDGVYPRIVAVMLNRLIGGGAACKAHIAWQVPFIWAGRGVAGVLTGGTHMGPRRIPAVVEAFLPQTFRRESHISKEDWESEYMAV